MFDQIFHKIEHFRNYKLNKKFKLTTKLTDVGSFRRKVNLTIVQLIQVQVIVVSI